MAVSLVFGASLLSADKGMCRAMDEIDARRWKRVCCAWENSVSFRR